MDDLGLYLSIPFCRAKCTFCNFASDAFAPGRLPAYIDRLCTEIATSRTRSADLSADLSAPVETVYFGGGTPSLLAPADIRRIFSSLRDQFAFVPDPEITVECAPGQLSPATLEEFQRQGVNRLSFGVQSFVDHESAAIGRLHTAKQCLSDIELVRSAGLLNLSLDLIAGLPHQTEISWRKSLETAIGAGVPHLSIYMLEVDDGSRLGREVLSDGTRYGAPSTPTDDQTAAFYEIACDLLNLSGIAQYEISNFARPGFHSLHNLNYWRRKPYLGLGLDAHSMLRTSSGEIRFSNTDDLDAYLLIPSSSRGEANSLKLFTSVCTPTLSVDRLTPEEVLEETLFLGLRINDGLNLGDLRAAFGIAALDQLTPALTEAASDGLLYIDQSTIRLTALGRVLSNEVFSRLLLPSAV